MDRVVAYSVRTQSDVETERFGAALGERITRGLVVSIAGPLGAGKTVLVRGLCRGLGIVDGVVSPTFVLLETFAGRLPVAHVDLYRLEHEREVEDIGVFDLIGGDTVVLVEWGERSPALHRAADVRIRIEPEGPSTRLIAVTASPEWANRIGGARC
jgi:tRNA threonylcarbamoyladenosine biosynthesis protein TsaE